MSFSSQSYQTQSCPACGAELVLKHRFSKTVVCSFCQSLLLLNNNNLQDQGKIATLSEDMSVLQIGSAGTFQNQSFVIIGRLKMLWKDGFWNEWYVLEENGNQAWICEAMGMYSYIYELEFPNELLSKLNAANLGQKIDLKKNTFILTDMKKFTLEGMEGELPVNMKKGIKGTTFDFKTHDNQCAYAEITGTENNFGRRFFIGEHATLDSLQITNLREFDDW